MHSLSMCDMGAFSARPNRSLILLLLFTALLFLGMPDALAPKAKKTYGAQRRGKKKGKRARRGPGRMV